MKNVKAWIIATIISISLVLSACSETTPSESKSVNSVPTNVYNTEFQEEIEQKNSSSETVQPPTSNSSDSQDFILKNSDEFTEINESQQIPDSSQNVFSIDEVIPYSGQPYIEINNNIPYFSEGDLTTKSFELYSNLDEYGRCGVAYANICIDIMPTEERGEIGQIRPSGWHTVKYNDIIDGNYLYNRCHLKGTEKLPFFQVGAFLLPYYIVIFRFFQKVAKNTMVYSIANSFSLTILFMFAVNAVKYI